MMFRHWWSWCPSDPKLVLRTEGDRVSARGSRVDLSREATEGMFKEFLGRYPEYSGTGALDELRDTEFSRLDRLGHVYVDYTGGGLFA